MRMRTSHTVCRIVALAAVGIAWLTASGIVRADEVAPATPAVAARAARPATWAQPLTAAGVPNFHKVSDALYRGAQPTAEGMRSLKQLGVKTVLNLRAFHSDKDELRNVDLEARNLSLKAWHPETEDAVAFLKIVTDRKLQPVFVHCQQGADRTGIMCAVYRVAVCGWSKEEAAKEMTEGGFGFHAIWTTIVPFLNALDVDKLRTAAGIASPAPPAATKN